MKIKKILLIFLCSVSILAAADSSESNWFTLETKDEMDDSVKIMTIVHARSKPVTMVVECNKEQTFLYINWRKYINSDMHPIIVRLDKEKAFTKQWGISTNNRASFYPSSPIPLLRKMMRAKQLIARVSPYGSSDITATFNIKGADTAFQKISKQCKWDAEDKSTSWIIQVAATSTKESAEKIQSKLKENSYTAYITIDSNIYRVFVGPYIVKEDAIRVAQEIEKRFKEKGIVRPFVPSKNN